VNVPPDHRARPLVAGLAEAGSGALNESPTRQPAQPPQLRGSPIPLLVLISLATVFSLPAQEVTVAPLPSRTAPAATTADAAGPTRRAAEANRAPAPATPVLNPLEGYLSDWMRPRDRALLRGEQSAAPNSAESWRRLAATSPTPRRPAPKPAPGTANPYIDAMNAAANTSPTTSATATSVTPANPGAPSLAPTAAAASLIEPEAPPPPPPTRYQPPPASDAKYFPQLKRF
jgi:hypothetical protein